MNTSILWIGRDFFVATLTSLIAGKPIAFLQVVDVWQANWPRGRSRGEV